MSLKLLVGPGFVVVFVVARLTGIGDLVSAQVRDVFDDLGPRLGIEMDAIPSALDGWPQPELNRRSPIPGRDPKCACVIREPAIASADPHGWPGREPWL
jgi:hypothetical protein